MSRKDREREGEDREAEDHALDEREKMSAGRIRFIQDCGRFENAVLTLVELSGHRKPQIFRTYFNRIDNDDIETALRYLKAATTEGTPHE